MNCNRGGLHGFQHCLDHRHLVNVLLQLRGLHGAPHHFKDLSQNLKHQHIHKTRRFVFSRVRAVSTLPLRRTLEPSQTLARRKMCSICALSAESVPALRRLYADLRQRQSCPATMESFIFCLTSFARSRCPAQLPTLHNVCKLGERQNPQHAESCPAQVPQFQSDENDVLPWPPVRRYFSPDLPCAPRLKRADWGVGPS